MILICAAYYNEAKAFIHHEKLNRIKDRNDLFSNHEMYLLITGEGLFQSLYQLTNCLSLLPSVDSILNLGLCGSLREQNGLKINQTILVRSIYSFMGQPEYHSFHTMDPNSKYDCVSTNKRIQNTKDKTALRPIADVVDRELWGQAYCAFKKKIPIRSIKLVSDFADEETNCRSIQKNSEKFSTLIYQKFLELKPTYISYLKQQTANNTRITRPQGQAGKSSGLAIKSKDDSAKTLIGVNDLKSVKKINLNNLNRYKLSPISTNNQKLKLMNMIKLSLATLEHYLNLCLKSPNLHFSYALSNKVHALLEEIVEKHKIKNQFIKNRPLNTMQISGLELDVKGLKLLIFEIKNLCLSVDFASVGQKKHRSKKIIHLLEKFKQSSELTYVDTYLGPLAYEHLPHQSQDYV